MIHRRCLYVQMVSPNGSDLGTQSTNDKFLSAVTYQSNASVIKKFNNVSTRIRGFLRNFAGGFNKSKSRFGKSGKKESDIIMRFRCHACEDHGNLRRLIKMVIVFRKISNL